MNQLQQENAISCLQNSFCTELPFTRAHTLLTYKILLEQEAPTKTIFFSASSRSSKEVCRTSTKRMIREKYYLYCAGCWHVLASVVEFFVGPFTAMVLCSFQIVLSCLPNQRRNKKKIFFKKPLFSLPPLLN